MLYGKHVIPDSYFVIELIFRTYHLSVELADNSFLQTMSLWAAIAYHVTFTTTSLQAPAAVTMWQHAYTLNTLLIVQETADTFGLLCIGLLFAGAQIFSRNSILSVFTMYTTPTENPSALSLGTTSTANQTKGLSLHRTTWLHLRKLLTSPLVIAKRRLRG